MHLLFAYKCIDIYILGIIIDGIIALEVRHRKKGNQWPTIRDNEN